MDVPHQVARLHDEINVRAVAYLNLTGAIYCTGNFHTDPLEQQILPSYPCCNIGARYEKTIFRRPTIFRFDGDNVVVTNNLSSCSFLRSRGYELLNYEDGE
jgi:hypothetical protein